MFVDDEEINLLLFEKRFEHDFKVITAASGIEALNKMEHHADQLKVVISDMRMPVMNGLQFIRQARQRFEDIHYFMLTGYSYDTELEQALKDHLIEKLFKKPYHYQTIIEAVGLSEHLPKDTVPHKSH